MKTSLLLVDDHAVVRQGMASLLAMTEDFDVVGEAANGSEAVEKARALQPELIVIDLLMPGIDGATAIRSILTVSPRSLVAVLTSSDDEALAFDAIEAGAQSFLMKSMSGDALLDAFRKMKRGESVIDASVAHRLLRAVRTVRQVKKDPFAALTDRELEVLRALAEGASNGRIAKTLQIGESTVKTHIGNVLGKLYLTDRTEAVAFAWREGLMGKGSRGET